MSKQTITSHTKPWGQRNVRVAYEQDVDAYLNALGTDLTALAEELGCAYAHAYGLAGELGLLGSERDTGARIRLSDDEAAVLREAVTARAEAEQRAVPLALAAEMIGLEISDVQTLVRQEVLATAEVPGVQRLRYVTVASIDAYNERHPRLAREDVSGQPAGAFIATAKLMGVDRRTLGVLVRTRRVQATTRGRQQRIVLASALGWAEEMGKVELASTLRQMIADASRS